MSNNVIIVNDEKLWIELFTKLYIQNIPPTPKEYLITNPYGKIEKDVIDFRYSHLTKAEREAKIVPVRTKPKIRNNEPCPCGSGLKYKKCCK